MVERPIQYANRQVDDGYLRRHWRHVSFSVEEASDCPVDEIDHEHPFGNGLRVVPPITCVLLQDGADVQWPRKCGVARSQVAVKNERRHRRAVSACGCGIVVFEVIRVVDDEPSLKSPVRLQRKPVEQRYDGNTHRLCLGQRLRVSFSMIVGKRRRHLAAGTHELNVLAFDEIHLVVQRLEQRLNLSDWDA